MHTARMSMFFALVHVMQRRDTAGMQTINAISDAPPRDTGFDFDHAPDRKATGSVKWDLAPAPRRLPLPPGVSLRRGDILPLWVADMDFAACPAVSRAVAERAAHPVYGYPLRVDSDYEAYISWMRRRNGWEVSREWILHTPGVVPALNLAVQAFSREGEGVVIQPPVYKPFRDAALSNGRVPLENPLKREDGRYAMDFDALERLLDGHARAPRATMLILCNPHNPVGRVWNEAELRRLASICALRGVTIVSDEIHSDILAPGVRHHCLPGISAEAARIGLVLSAPNKTFNIAGIPTANIVIPDPALRAAFAARIAAAGLGVPDLFGLVATKAAYEEGEPWLAALNAYIRSNYLYLAERLAKGAPMIRHDVPEGGYLVWLDFRALGLDDESLRTLLLDGAGVWLDEGEKFGTGGTGFMRLNLACTRSLLACATDRILRSLDELAAGRRIAGNGDGT